MSSAPELPRSVFVYGTLRSDQIRSTCWPCQPLKVSVAYVRGELYDLGPYPAMTDGETAIAGELWEFLAEDMSPTLATLDEIEGYRGSGQRNLYERRILAAHDSPDLMNNEPVKAFGYLMRRSILPAKADLIRASLRISSSPARFARWPRGSLAPSITSALPDPFPDDIPPLSDP